MKAQLLQWAAKVDALSLRERGILFFAVIAVALAAVDAAILTPAQTQFKAVQQRFATQSAEIARVRSELQSAGKPVDQNQAVRESIGGVEQDIAGVNQDIQTQLALAGSGRALEPVLVQFLRRQPNLTLLGTSTLKSEAAAIPGLTRQGLELRVAGPYLELTRYVQNLESALPHLRWGSVQIKAEQQPPEMSLQVYVLGVAP
jgi:MSHA biogenesis protein MshJ